MKSYKRRYQSATKKHLLYALAVALLAALTTGVVQHSVQAKEVIQNDTTYVMTKGSQKLLEGATRTSDSSIKAKFYLGEAAHGDDPSSSNESPILWDILGPANTNTNIEDAINFIIDKIAAGSNPWGVYSTQSSTGTDLTDQSILAISHNVTTQSVFSNSGSQAYQGSDLKNTMDNLSYLTTPEEAFALYTYKTDAATTDVYSGKNYKESKNILQGSQFFPLSAREAVTYWANTSKANPLRLASGAYGRWWLRSASGSSGSAGFVGNLGGVDARDVGGTCGVRAAFNSNLNSLIFTSLSGTDYVLPAYDTGTANLTSMAVENTPQVPAYRLTLLDTTLNSCAPKSTSPIKAAAGSTVTLGYEGAVVKENAYVSCYITDSANGKGNILYAGHIAKIDKAAEGKAQVKIPEALPAGNYSLVVYEEQDNNCTAGNNVKGKLTNCAGEIKDDKNVIKLTVEAQPDKFSITYKAAEGGTVDPTAEEVQENIPAKGSTAKANLGYTFTNWTDEEGNIVSSDATFVPVQSQMKDGKTLPIPPTLRQLTQISSA